MRMKFFLPAFRSSCAGGHSSSSSPESKIKVAPTFITPLQRNPFIGFRPGRPRRQLRPLREREASVAFQNRVACTVQGTSRHGAPSIVRNDNVVKRLETTSGGCCSNHGVHFPEPLVFLYAACITHLLSNSFSAVTRNARTDVFLGEVETRLSTGGLAELHCSALRGVHYRRVKP